MDKVKLIRKIKINFVLELITGLRIGDSKDSVEIGGVDLPIIRRKDNLEPYIPGSSIKGKIRSLLDIAHGFSDTTRLSDDDNIIACIFGCSKRKSSEKGNPSRVIFRDAYLSEESKLILKDSEFTDMPYSEIKPENSINRLTGTAKDPRFVERVPAGSKFNVEIILNIIASSLDIYSEEEQISLLEKGLNLLEKDYLGSSGSRGYGQIKILNKIIDKKYYESL